MSGSPHCVERWACPHCLVVGQTRAGHELSTNLAAHLRVVHPEKETR